MLVIDDIVNYITRGKAREFDQISDKLINANLEIKRLRKLVKKAALSIDSESVSERILEELDAQNI